MSEVVTLVAELRENLGTGPTRALRRKGLVPCIIYGSGKKPLAISIIEKDITKHYRKSNFSSSVIQLEIGEKKHKVLPKDIDLHPITDIVRHVDFIYLDSKEQQVLIPLVYEGKDRAVGIKRGGFFNIVKRHISLMCPSSNIPKNIIIDVSNMFIGQSIKAGSINLPEGCNLVDKKDLVIASITGRGSKADAEEVAAEAAVAPAAK
jgi:large subunit ribosomal protein L25